jgi:uncharacterized membrane protein YoaK (UPF0700 family)
MSAGGDGASAPTVKAARASAERLLPTLFLALTFVTGIVDATSFLRLGRVFVAIMTGNIVFLGFGIAGAGDISAWKSLTALSAFFVGAFVGGRVASATADDRHRHVRAAVGVQAVFVTAALALAAAGEANPDGGIRYPLVALLAVAMGIQTSVARTLALPDLTTTVLTHTLTGIASDSRLAGGADARIIRRGLAVISMLLGAVAGGLLALHVGVAASLGLATAFLLAVVVTLLEPVKSRLQTPPTSEPAS